MNDFFQKTILERCMCQNNDKANYTAGIIIKHMFDAPNKTENYKHILMKMLYMFNQNAIPEYLKFINNEEETHDH